MHYVKYGKAAVGSILLHSDRGIDSPDTHEHSNENIDRSRTHLNYDLKERGGQTAYAYYKQRIDRMAAETKERTGKSIRKDAVTLCSWAVTAPKDLPEDKQADFFKAAYDWFSERYGADNIVTAAVHMDESTPHMHLQFTPIIEKDGVRKLCAKELETQRTLATAHQKLQKYLEKSLGCEVNLLNGATEGGNKTLQQLKAEKLAERVEELETKIVELTPKYEKMTKTLSDKELKEIDTTPKRITGGFKDLSSQQAQELVNTSLALSKENRQLRSKNSKLSEDNERLKSEKNRVVAEKNKVVYELFDIKQEKQVMFNRQQLEQVERERQAKEKNERLQKQVEQSETEIDSLKEFMGRFELADGSTVLDRYNELTKPKKMKRNRGFER